MSTKSPDTKHNAAVGKVNPGGGSLFRRYLVLIMALVGGALVASGALALYGSYQDNLTNAARLQKESALRAAGLIEQYISGIASQLHLTLTQPLAQDSMEQLRLEFLKLLRQTQAITDVSVLDRRGVEVLHVSRLATDTVDGSRDASASPAFQNARSGSVWVGPVYFRKGSEPYFTLAQRSGGQDFKVAVAEVNLKFLWDVVSTLRVGKTGKAYVVDTAGLLVADPDMLQVLKKVDMSSLSQVQAALGKLPPRDGPWVSANQAGVDVSTAWAPITTLGWQVMVEQPTSEVFETLQKSLWRSALLLLAGLVVSGLAATALARSMVRPIRQLQEGTQRVARGVWDQPIEVNTGDELQALATQFNAMSSMLKDSYSMLEQRVQERTAQLSALLERQTATVDLLRVIATSPSDTQPLFQAIVDAAARLLNAQVALVVVFRHGEAHLAASTRNEPRPLLDLGSAFPLSLSSLRLPEPAQGGGDTAVQLEDAAAIAHTLEPLASIARAQGWQVALWAPVVKEGQTEGGILVARHDAAAFGRDEVLLLESFASQATISLANVRLFTELRNKTQQLAAANDHKSQFLANMSHELRTPLNAVIGFSEVMAEGMVGDLNERQLDYVKDIHESGRHLLSLINDILDLSKIEAGRMELEPGVFDLPSAIGNALTLVRERAQRHQVALVSLVSPECGSFVADERKFKQVMLNLLSNAVKFTRPGGKVSVDAWRVNGGVQVTVSDTGIGISQADQVRVFDEFVQVGTDYTTKAEGTGLGLALCRRFAELQGGRIWLESELGKGSKFHFWLPCLPEEMA